MTGQIPPRGAPRDVHITEDVSKNCVNCKHKDVQYSQEPCHTCAYDAIQYSKWTPLNGQALTVEPTQHDTPAEIPSGGAMLRGKNYYQVHIPEPMNPDRKPYVAECADIIEALGMTFNEGEAFKALWRGAAARTLGIVKNTAQYDADKAAHYGQRVAVQVRRGNPAKE